jgi:hypothetical protein
MNSLSAWHLAGFAALHLGAIAAAIATRVASGTRFELHFQFLFLPALAAVGYFTWYCHAAELGIGIPSGITLIAMVLVAVTDVRRTHEPAGHHHNWAVNR